MVENKMFVSPRCITWFPKLYSRVQKRNEYERTPVRYHWVYTCHKIVLNPERNELTGINSKLEECVLLLSTCGSVLLRDCGWSLRSVVNFRFLPYQWGNKCLKLCTHLSTKYNNYLLLITVSLLHQLCCNLVNL